MRIPTRLELANARLYVREIAGFILSIGWIIAAVKFVLSQL